jgi:hypothetical protein
MEAIFVMKKRSSCLGCLGIILFCFVFFISFLILISVFGKSSTIESKKISQKTSIEKNNTGFQSKDENLILELLKKRPEFGSKIKEITNAPNWARGNRKYVTTDKGEYLYYFYEESIVSVRKNTYPIEFYKIKEVPIEYDENIVVEADNENGIPEYKILLIYFEEPKIADVLVDKKYKQFSKKEIEKIITKISKKENFSQMTLYCTEESYKANISSDYNNKHPNALDGGLLGSIGLIEEGVIKVY